MSSTFTLDRAAFAAWLVTLPQTVPFAFARSCAHCPLAQCLKAHGAPRTTEVYEGEYTFTGRLRDVFTLPAWATEFVQQIDRTQDTNQVTPEQALAVLATIPEEATA